MKDFLIKILPYLIIFILAFFLYRGCEKEKEVIVIEKIIPEEIIVYDTVFSPQPIVVKEIKIDSTYYFLYKNAEQRIKDSLFEKSIEINDYIISFNDSLADVDVYTSVRGEVLKQTAKTTVHERKIIIRDTIEKLKDQESKSAFYIGSDFYYNHVKGYIDVIPEINFKTKNGKTILSLGANHQTVQFGILKKL